MTRKFTSGRSQGREFEPPSGHLLFCSFYDPCPHSNYCRGGLAAYTVSPLKTVALRLLPDVVDRPAAIKYPVASTYCDLHLGVIRHPYGLVLHLKTTYASRKVPGMARHRALTARLARLSQAWLDDSEAQAALSAWLLPNRLEHVTACPEGATAHSFRRPSRVH
ncbi:uncharacterized protein BP01DRAFT_145828 [Aspergillus saccharolyticus JOP 1030-1]|uniref:Uncharacterized protein n=1 Tax=Aspergillus saccharolyticus JOP 1030-1 TaxID=1450539 RepID=A0A318ZNW8_9EURO|nr:hypothetical protein BP01DRAFT_145828 [Aspergillus saccharolyticus JOP 1030-1]PYH48345.1 hypothetical protein BP01DRAFT_145828 [Aspergillus saccharolyticus JOP 1030-1]